MSLTWKRRIAITVAVVIVAGLLAFGWLLVNAGKA